jgi:hypothetical protein
MENDSCKSGNENDITRKSCLTLALGVHLFAD